MAEATVQLRIWQKGSDVGDQQQGGEDGARVRAWITWGGVSRTVQDGQNIVGI
ncbi:hypothetical protein [Streptomyces sp. NBC_00829]|uniref:hypothetical protein n=1 Tax=Streptomyces sp. NBC_00829 TaxID=2903679 RepID=UPI00386D3DC7|nr:hypothetical protein OG293_17680 [Streptomyces sp. NBC_00829]